MSLLILKTFPLEVWDVQHLFFVSSVYFFVILPFWEKAFGVKKSQHDLIHSKHLRDLSRMIFINCSLIKKMFVNWKFPRFSSFRFWFLCKNRKLGNIFKTCSCFPGRSWKYQRFPSFRFWLLCKNRKLGKLGNFFKTCSYFVGESWKFPSFPSFQFQCKGQNQKLGKLGIFFKICSCFTGRSWTLPWFPSFRFWPLCWNRKLGKLGHFFKACKIKWICSV